MAKKRFKGSQFIPKRAKVATMGGMDLEIPNHSGDNSAGTILSTPVNDNDMVNKVYVDDSIAAIPTPTIAHADTTGKTTDDHHAQIHATNHEVGGSDLVNHDDLTGFVADEHINWTNATDNFATVGTIDVTHNDDSDAIDIDHNISSGTSNANTVDVDLDITGTGNRGTIRGFNSHVQDSTTTGTTTNITGGRFVTNTAGNATTTMLGIEFGCVISGATVTNASAVSGNFVNSGGGTITNAKMFTTGFTGSWGSTITNATGYDCGDMSFGSSTTNSWALKIASQGTNAESYAIYSTGTTEGSKVYLGGRFITANGIERNTTRVTTTYTVLISDDVIFANTDGAAYTITLPAGVEGQTYRIINSGSGGNDLTVASNGSEHINGTASNLTLTDGQKEYITFNTNDGWY